jgi:hypothetical protein
MLKNMVDMATYRLKNIAQKTTTKKNKKKQQHYLW